MIYVEFTELVGKTLTNISGKVGGDEELEFTASDGSKYVMFHLQDCCESVQVEDICGDLRDLLDSPILEAEEATNRDEDPEGCVREYRPDSFTWTFYKLRTIKGGVTIRWYGTSNGYYSEGVSFARIK